MHSYAFCSSSHGHPLCFCWFWFCHLKVVLGCPSFFRIPHALKHVPISQLSQSLEVNKYNARYARSGLTPMVAMMMYLLCQCIFSIDLWISMKIWYQLISKAVSPSIDSWVRSQWSKYRNPKYSHSVLWSPVRPVGLLVQSYRPTQTHGSHTALLY